MFYFHFRPFFCSAWYTGQRVTTNKPSLIYDNVVAGSAFADEADSVTPWEAEEVTDYDTTLASETESPDFLTESSTEG